MRVFEIKYPGLYPPLSVLELLMSINSVSLNEVKWGGYSKYADSIVRMENLTPWDKRLAGLGKLLDEYISEFPELNPERAEFDLITLPIFGLYDDVFGEVTLHKKKQKEYDPSKSLVFKKEDPMVDGFLKGMFGGQEKLVASVEAQNPITCQI